MKKVILSIVVLTTLVALFIFTRFQVVRQVDINAYIITSNKLVNNLVNTNDKKAKIDYMYVDKQDTIYKNALSYYVGEKDKVSISFDYPIISSDSDEILVMNDNFKYIDSNYEKTDSYENTYIASNSLYNGFNYDKVDNNQYIFLELENKIFTGLQNIQVKDEVIPTNSIMYFLKDSIRYYYLDNGQFVLEEITGIDKSDPIIIFENEYNYEELLNKLDVDAILSDYENEYSGRNGSGGGINNNEEEKIEPEEIEIVEEPDDVIEDNNEEENSDEENKELLVSFEDSYATTYSYNGHLNIKDTELVPDGVTFEFKQNGKLFLKKTFYDTGDVKVTGFYPNTKYTVVGYYNYIRNDKKYKKPFFNDEFTTESIPDNSYLKFAINNIKPSSSSFIIENITLNNSIDDEILLGLKKIVFKIGAKEYQMPVNDVLELKKIKTVSYSSPLSLASNKVYDVEIIPYDIAGNIISSTNNTFQVKTSKNEPYAVIKTLETEVNKAKISLEIQNVDNINIINKNYILYDSDNTLLSTDYIEDDTFIINNLDTNKVYTIEVYGDYDLEDGQGIRRKQQLGKTKFITNNLTSLGYPKLKLENVELTSKNATYNIYLELGSTNEQLREVIDSFTFIVREKNKDDIAYETTITYDEVYVLKNGMSIVREIRPLYSNTEYEIEIVANVILGGNTYYVPTTKNIETFKTFKTAAKVDIINRYISENIIDFDVKITDPDHAILSKNVRLDVRNALGSLVYFKYLDINSNYERITLDKLDKDERYTFTYTVEEYNDGDTNATFVNWKVLHEETIVTERSIYGLIRLDSLLNQVVNINLFDLSNSTRWKYSGDGIAYTSTDVKQDILTLGSKNGVKIFSYYLPEYTNQTVTVSFYARYLPNGNKNSVYINNRSTTNDMTILEGLTETYKKYTKTFVVKDGYISFIVNEVEGNNDITYVEFKNIQIEEGSTATTYKPYVKKNDLLATYVINIEDITGLIYNGSFYLRTFNNGNLENIKKYDVDLSDIHDYEITYEAKSNCVYTVYLSVLIYGKYYDISYVTFDSSDEIRTIKTIDDLFAIHTYGNYLVADDLDLRQSNKTFSSEFEFGGTIDFQGHKLLRSVTHGGRLIYSTKNTAVFKNLDLVYEMDNTAALNDYGGLFYQFLGKLSNFKLTINSSTNVGNQKAALIAVYNNGIIENFVINCKESFNASKESAIITRSNYGIIRNGYVYGKNINATYRNTSSRKDVAIIAVYNYNSATISNIYSLIGIDVTSDLTTGDNERLVGNIATTVVNLKNVYTYAGGENRITDGDPNIGSRDIIANTSDVYYYGETIYDDYSISQKISKLALRESIYQNKVLNNGDDNRIFDVDNLIKYGYFPHIIWPECMPNQEYIELPIVEDADLVDIITISNVEYNGEKTNVTLIVNNPNLETITNFGVYLINSVNVLSQEDMKGKSVVKIELSDPIKYTSKYFVKNIVTSGAGGEFTVNYLDGERVLNVDMYRPIYNVMDFMDMKNYNNENFIIMNDLDLSLVPNPQIGNIGGKINGNNHVISNITINSTGSSCFIDTLSNGYIFDLFVENYTKENIDGIRGGFICFASNSVIDNVHLSNVRIALNGFVGGLIAEGEKVTISNSSVSDFALIRTDNGNTNMTKVGGLVGRIQNSGDVKNTFVRDVFIDVSKAHTGDGIAGFIGSFDSGTMTSCYAEGKVISGLPQVGGLVGYNGGSIEKSFSKVDIIAMQDYVGGIVGRSVVSTFDSLLSVGNLYSVKDISLASKSSNFNRIRGDAQVGGLMFAADFQLINGLESGKTNGETLLSREELSNSMVYETTIHLGEYFNYTGVTNGSLPKLLNSNTKELLPNQVDIKIEENELLIEEIRVSQSNERIEELTVVIKNPHHYNITGLEIENMTINNVSGIIADGDFTYITLIATPTKYYDSYMITAIKYNDENNTPQEYEVQGRIEAIFYKNIGSASDWNNLIDPKSLENYIITNDIDFADTPITNVGVKINRLIGLGEGKAIRNVNYTFPLENTGVIDTISSLLKDITFDGGTIKCTGSYDKYFGYIKFMNGNIENITVRNITIEAKRTNNYVGFIAFGRVPDFRDILLENVSVSGRTNTGAFFGGISNTRDGINVTMRNIYVNGNNSNTIGGFCGDCSKTGDGKWYHFDIDTLTVENGKDNVGGVFGNGVAFDIRAKNININGKNNVGGITANGAVKNVFISDSTITGSGNNVAGITAKAFSGNYLFADNIKVINNSTTSECTAGLVTAGGSRISNLGIKNSEIITQGNYAGGIRACGDSLTTTDFYVENTKVSAQNYAGGVIPAAKNSSTNISNFSVNASVSTSGQYAGGVVGYVKNGSATTTTDYTKIINGMIINTSVSAYEYAGGLVGYQEKKSLKDQIKSIAVVADVSAINEASYKTASAVIGNNDRHANYDILSESGINGLRVHQDSNITINGVTTAVKDANTGINSEILVPISDFALETTYTAIGISSNDNSMLSENYYPKKIDSLFDNIYFNDIYPNFISINAGAMLSLNHSNFTALPNVYVYPSGVDSINIEFSNVPEVPTSFTIQNNTYPITNPVYTLQYDYQTDFDIIIDNGISNNEISVNAEDLQNNVFVTDDDFYIINNNDIVSSDSLSLDTINSSAESVSSTIDYGNSYDKNYRNYYNPDEYTVSRLANDTKNTLVNIYDNKILLSDGKIYDIEKGTITNNSIDNFKIIENKPLYEFDYSNSKIKTYYNYSTIDNLVFDGQIFVKNNVLEVIDSSLSNKKNNLTLDEYNGKSSIIYLGKDKRIHNLKDSIKYPKSFINKGIESISSNITNNSTIIAIIYENNNIMIFDYKNGEILYEYKDSKPDIYTYINDHINKESDQKIDKDYKYSEANELIEKLNKSPIESILNDVESNKSLYYQSVYNPATEDYDIYELPLKNDYEDDLMSRLNNQPLNNIINNNMVLSAFYNNDAIVISSNIYLLIVLIIIIIIILFGVLRHLFINKRENY